MKQVIVVRSDLSMGEGKIAAQVGHACVLSIINNESFVYQVDAYDKKIQEWLFDGMSKIVVGCNSEEELWKLMALAKEMGVAFHPVKDAGRTEVDPSTLTCCAFGPDEDKALNKITGALKLL